MEQVKPDSQLHRTANEPPLCKTTPHGHAWHLPRTVFKLSAIKVVISNVHNFFGHVHAFVENFGIYIVKSVLHNALGNIYIIHVLAVYVFASVAGARIFI